MSVYISMKIQNNNDAQNQWDYVLTNFGIPPENVWMRNDLDLLNYHGKYTQTHGTAFDLDPNIPLVVVQPLGGRYIQGNISLIDFVHPNSAIYLFGGDNDNLSSEEDLGGRNPDYLVYIPTATHDEMYSWVAASCVLYDRLVKNG